MTLAKKKKKKETGGEAGGSGERCEKGAQARAAAPPSDPPDRLLRPLAFRRISIRSRLPFHPIVRFSNSFP